MARLVVSVLLLALVLVLVICWCARVIYRLTVEEVFGSILEKGRKMLPVFTLKRKGQNEAKQCGYLLDATTSFFAAK